MLTSLPVKQFCAEVASSSPAPGGGSVSALAGAQAAALLSMYCRLTIGREKYADVAPMMADVLSEADNCRAELTELVDEDTMAFAMVMDAYRLPKLTAEEKEKRRQAIQLAYKEAAGVPFAVCKQCLRLLELIESVAGKGNEGAASDIGVANLQAYAGLTGAAYNVLINLASIHDPEFVTEYHGKLGGTRRSAEICYGKTQRVLEEELGL